MVKHFKIVFLILGVSLVGLQAAMADPAQWKKEGWDKTDFSKSIIDFGQIFSGGPPKDGIPSLDDPKFHRVNDEKDLGPDEPVIGLEINGDARGYPVRILMWHEIVNDTVGGVPVAVTYCPLCNTSIVFKRELDGRLLDFGTTGKLRFSDLVMYDRQTESWWQQFTGKAIVGQMTGKVLTPVPSRLESFAQFKKRFPNGKVLAVDKRFDRSYGLNPYVNYDSSKAPFLYRGDMPEGIPPMARVVAFKSEGEFYAVSLALLREMGSMTMGQVRLQWRKGQNSALDSSMIKKGRDVGNVIVQKMVSDMAIDIRYEVTFAFAFHAFHPERPIKTSR